LTGRRAQSNSATPEIAQSKGKRFGYFEEPEGEQRIDVGLMKEMSGGDRIKARPLFKDPIEFKPQFKLLLLCNDLPKVPADDDGTWRRLCGIEFTSKFVSKPVRENEFPIDKYLSEKLVKWKEAFMYLLVTKYYKMYRQTGLNPPDEVTKFTREYQRNCDAYVDFIESAIINTHNEHESIAMTTLYDEFKSWYMEQYGGGSGTKTPPRKDLKKYLEKAFGKKMVTNEELKGCKFKSSADADVINNDIIGDSDDEFVNNTNTITSHFNKTNTATNITTNTTAKPNAFSKF
jgi:phage/plasmid-associated DNA primase